MLLNQLHVKSPQGHYFPASLDQALQVVRDGMRQKYQGGTEFTSPMLVKEYLWSQLASLEHEVFSAIFLDNQHRLLEYVVLFRGTLDQASVYPREVVKEALRLNAAAVIFSHNHPSGSPDPSEADKLLTKHLKEALKLIEVRVLDHIIVAGSGTTSFAERGLL